ncbi:hypothetical protein KBZ18_02790 [Synechococcus sp. Cruz-9H2]|uniref:Coq4 family protein n=1 Tax=unclassified Synechococcus TaxID=2626047 RepID=UPI0020CD33CC|nr:MULTISPECIES: Coq4 family protein [unclassified Synechococcus]MCP9818418.1 hypothetical protein [Synechococcus sp. Cruz-9H2]MCP9842647.1 hypothetical protein [Synechococcus sp. Edmonson 11F2]MCP9855311.1 hypothetical protein [Synechococcus sp. Cruz-9C9]MCP9862441.1 hypothetical protein [Synechococcus sp. Cruz-7E5]MCP9869713.1 hypothetical protein [Synechococcus sp. Cruz-7B9]
MTRFAELLRSLNNLKLLAAIGRSGGDLGSVADLVDNLIDSPQMADCVRRFRAVPGGAELMDGRYPPLQPDIDSLIQLPEGSLGHSYAHLIRQLNYDPEFFRPRPVDTEARWLTQRIATTHDIHHVVSGFGTAAVGESGVLAITASQIGFPAYVLLTTAGQLASFRLQLERFELLSRALAHGMAIGHSASCLALARWEEGWERPVADWRQELGITDPADHESYGLAVASNQPG